MSLPGEYFFTRLLFTPQRLASVFGDDFDAWKSMAWWQWLSVAASQTDGMDRFTKISWLELRSYLVNTLLRDADAMSMQNSLEVRVPFLDLPLVEYVLSLPEGDKFERLRPKSLLIDALGDLLPEEIVAQRKRTFTFPWDNWLRGELGRHVAKGIAEWSPILESEIAGRFAADTWRDFLDGRTSWSRPWSLYVLNEWVKRHLSSAPVRTMEEASLSPSAN